METNLLENLFNKYQQEGTEIQNALNAKKELYLKTQQEINELEHALTYKKGNIEAVQTIYNEENKAREEASELKDEKEVTSEK